MSKRACPTYDELVDPSYGKKGSASKQQLLGYLKTSLKRQSKLHRQFKDQEICIVEEICPHIVQQEERALLETKLRQAAEAEVSKIQPAPVGVGVSTKQLAAVLGNVNDPTNTPTGKLAKMVATAVDVMHSRHGSFTIDTPGGKLTYSPKVTTSTTPPRAGSIGSITSAVEAAMETAISAGESQVIISSADGKYRAALGDTFTFKTTVMDLCSVCFGNSSDGVCKGCCKAMCESCFSKCAKCPFCRQPTEFKKLADTSYFYC